MPSPSVASLHSSKNTTSCLDASSAFYQVLMAPYHPLPRVRTPPSTLITPQEAELCRSIVDWSREPLPPPEHDSSDEDDTPSVTSSANSADLERLIYKPSGKWDWARGLVIEDAEILMHLGSGLMCSATIKKGTLGGRSVTYISKTWSKQKQAFWRGFHSELALYKSNQYLRPLQGTVVPPVIGVFALPGEISVAMEPPHHSFWIEASSNMPKVLKEKCISAFERLHSAGVLHGDVELRHMLIGGDGKVTIIDFQASRALVPNDDVMLQRAKPEEFRMEMRKVKYKLDYDRAREKESKKMTRCHERSQKNRIRRMKLQQRARGDRPGYISDIEEDSEEDKVEPPVHKQDWNEHWVVVHAEPRRFVMPNQTPEDLEREIRQFFAIVEGMESKAVAKPQDSRLVSTPPFLIAPAIDQDHRLSAKPRYTLRKLKRKDHSPSPSRTSKRFRSAPSETVTSRSECIDGIPSEVPASGGRFPPVKVRDFAYESYDGPRGFYVPHSPTEERASRERQWYIHLLNTQRCWMNGLPHPAVLSLQGGQGLLRTAQNTRGKRLMVQMGSLKRAREDSEHPGGVDEWAAQKKARYKLTKKGDMTTGIRKRKRHGGEEVDGFMTPELSALPEGPKIISRAEYLTRPTSSQRDGACTTLRSIMRKTIPRSKEHRTGSGGLRVLPLRRSLEMNEGLAMFPSEHGNVIMAVATQGSGEGGAVADNGMIDLDPRFGSLGNDPVPHLSETSESDDEEDEVEELLRPTRTRTSWLESILRWLY